MTRLVAPTGARPIVEENGTMTQELRTWINEANRLLPQAGTGSPEGVVEADLDSQYYDRNGTTGTIIYIKLQSDIGGDRSQGWVLA